MLSGSFSDDDVPYECRLTGLYKHIAAFIYFQKSYLQVLHAVTSHHISNLKATDHQPQ